MSLSNSEKNRLKEKYGSWAVVTGASSGIGLELATLLASAGLNIILNARRQKELDSIKETLEKAHPIKCLTIASDLSDMEGIQKLISATEGFDIGLLVASAGFGTSGSLINNKIEDEVNMIRVNCEALLVLTHYFSQLFAKKQKGGLILLSSMVAFQGVPSATNYSATKAYVQSLAEGLSHEMKPYNVDVLAAAPGPVASGFGSRADMQMKMSLTPQQVGVPILKALGRKTTVFPGLLTKILVYSLSTVPRWAKILIMKNVMGDMVSHQNKK